MKKIRLNRKIISQIFWHNLLLDFRCKQERWRKELESEIDENSNFVRPQILATTGTLTINEAAVLYSAVKYFDVKTIVEIGTFIGTSTTAMAKAVTDNGFKDGRLWTCDYANDVRLKCSYNIDLKYFGQRSSTDMLRTIDQAIDFFFIDGTLRSEDIDHIARLSTENSILLLDDFEGLEKGVRNAFSLEKNFADHLVIYPMSEAQATELGYPGACKFCFLLPRNTLALTRQ